MKKGKGKQSTRGWHKEEKMNKSRKDRVEREREQNAAIIVVLEKEANKDIEVSEELRKK